MPRRASAAAAVLACALLWVAVGVTPAAAYELDPVLSLTGDCSTDAVDPVPDPGCPGGEHPPRGRFNGSNAVAIDPYGNEYVANVPENERTNGRVDVFDDEGTFITELGGVSNPKSIAVDSEANLYVLNSLGDLLLYEPTAASQPELGIVKYEDPPVTIGSGVALTGAVAVDTDGAHQDQLLLVRSGIITRYKSAAEGNGVIATSGNVGGATGWTEAMAIDAQRRLLYVSYCANETTECGVKVLDADTFVEAHAPITGPSATKKFATGQGQLPIGVDEETGAVCIGDINLARKIYCFDESYELIETIANSNFQATSSPQIAVSNGESSPDVDASNRHYLFVPVLLAAGRVFAFKPPDVRGPVIENIFTAGIGETEAQLGARIKPRGAETEYAFEYLTEQKFEEQGGQFTGASVAGQGTITGETFEAQVSAQLGGLQPGLAYRFRVVAGNEAGEAEEEGSFTTYSDAASIRNCPNQALRVGASAALPDCRAYELVTPPSTNGKEPKGLNVGLDVFTTVQASPGGDAVTFRIEGGSLPGTTGTGGFNGDPYAATRSGSGWATSLAGPSGGEATVTIPGAVSADQGYSFWTGREEGSAVIDDAETHYVRYPDGRSELIGRGSLGTNPGAGGQYIAPGGAHIVFGATQQLEPDAPPSGTQAIYDRTADGVTHVVSLLPGNVTPAAGQGAAGKGTSPDGEGIAFEVGGTLYLRKDNTTTYEIGAGLKSAGISEGGERIFYLKDGDLFAYDTSLEAVIPFTETLGPTSGDVTPVNVATGGTRAAFVSPSVLGGANPEGEVAQAGEQNLYLSHEGQIELVATVTDRDVEGELAAGGVQVDGLGLWSEVATGSGASDPSRLSPSGATLLFQSRAELTGYDPEGSPQVYRYDSEEGRLLCLSCVPTGAPAGEGAVLQSLGIGISSLAPLSPVVRVPNLTPSGDRVFFESTEALVSTDTDGLRDVYEWEEEGVGSCERSGGCTYLISSGHSERDNYLYGHSRGGNDVFFTTADVLTGSDGGATVSIYDARVNGGFPEPVSAPCEGEGCRPALSAPPATPAPESGARSVSGNLLAKAKRCAQGRRKAKRLSVRAKRLRRAARRVESPRTARRMRRKAARDARLARRVARKARRCRHRRHAGAAKGRAR